MEIPLRCRCGRLQGRLAAPHRVARAVCYCRDCQAFARFLGEPDRILDAQGGTLVVAALPREVRFTEGTENLRCMSLSPKGLLRWYAGCCRTPIANTPRDPRTSYAGIVHSCLADSPQALDALPGTRRVAAVNTGSASGKVAATPWTTFTAVIQVFSRLVRARLGGGWRHNPFFKPGTAEPIVAPEVLTREQRSALTPG